MILNYIENKSPRFSVVLGFPKHFTVENVFVENNVGTDEIPHFICNLPHFEDNKHKKVKFLYVPVHEI